MSEPAVLHLIDDNSASTVEEVRVFVRSISTPAGAPWDQAQAAGLEARLGSPAALSDLAYQVRRMEAWRWGQPSRFAAFYVRARAVRTELVRTVDVDGRAVQVRFLSAEEQNRRTRATIILLTALLVSGGLTTVTFISTLNTRNATEAALFSTERTISSRKKQLEEVERLKAQTQALDALGVRHLKISDLLTDLNWASAARAPDSRIEAFHWQRGAMAVEVRGKTAPFSNDERTVRKSDHPIRAGVWLWGVSPSSIYTAQSESVRGDAP